MSVVKINRLSAPAGAGAELEQRFVARRRAVDGWAGFEGLELLRPTGDHTEYFVVTRWADEASFQAWRDQRTPRDPAVTVSRSEGVLEFEVVDLDA